MQAYSEIYYKLSALTRNSLLPFKNQKTKNNKRKGGGKENA